MDYIIIGASAAGVSAAETIRQSDPKGKITVVSDENYPIYSRCLLSYYLAGAIPEEKLKYRPDDFFSKLNINAVKGEKVLEITKDKKAVLSGGSKLPFDKLLIATGSRSKMEKIPGVDKKGVFGLRNVNDAKNIDALLGKAKAAVMLGGGLIGLRAAYALHKRGLKVTVVVKSAHILSQMSDAEGAGIVQKKIQEEGISVLTGLSAKEIMGGSEVTGVMLENGQRLDCQVIVVGKGVEANIELVKSSGIKTDWGIIVDEFLQSSMADVYAAGDVAQSKDLVTGESAINALWPNAVIQGKIAGLNMAGKKIRYDGSMAMNSVEFFGLPTISCGVSKPKDGSGYEIITSKSEKSNVYKKFVIKDNKLAGFVLVNEVDSAGVYNSLIRKKVDISSIKDKLTYKNFDFSKILKLAKANPDKFSEREYQELVIK